MAAMTLLVAGTIVAGAGYMKKGRAEKRAAEHEAGQAYRQAGQEQASGQRSAAEERRSARYVMSRAQALAAASGASATDPTIVNLMGDIEAEGEYRALTALYGGEERALGYKDYAEVRRREGSAAQTAGYIGATSTLLSGGSTLAGKYG